MRRLCLVLEYDGTDFVGWQVQSRGRSVQGELEDALAELAGEPVPVRGAGRTDAGVHAAGQVAHLDWTGQLGPDELRGALDTRLPRDLSVLDVRRVDGAFDARRDALSKRYAYRILCRSHPSPLRRRFVWHRRGALDLAAMRRAAEQLIGHHDFAAFRGAHGGPPPHQDSRRTLDRLEIRTEADEIRVCAEGRSFLRYMVRNLVGTLVEVASGRLEPDAIPAILAGRDRARAGPTAPAHGLCLESIRYPDLPESAPESG